MTGCIAIHCTAPTREEADRLTAALMERRLAACCHIEPIRSVYRWQGAVEQADEHRVTAKTTTACFADVAACLAELHPYDVPEIVAFAILDGSPDYLAWIAEQVA